MDVDNCNNQSITITNYKYRYNYLLNEHLYSIDIVNIIIHYNVYIDCKLKYNSKGTILCTN